MIRTLKISAAVAIAGAFSVAQAATTCTDTPKQYGPISIQKAGSKCFAVIDADGPNHNDPVVITETETVDSVYYFRKNSATSAKQTIVLPVYPSQGCKPTATGANLSNIRKIYINTKTNWTVLTNPIVTSSAGFEANHPYLIEFSEEDSNGLYFKLGGNSCTFDLKTTDGAASTNYSADPDPKAPTGLNGTWEFRGVYTTKTWDANDTERKNSYGFVGEKTKGKIGEFKKAGADASVPPLRAYLVYNSNGVLAKAAPGLSFAPAADDSDLLSASMDVIEDVECFQDGDGIFEVKNVLVKDAEGNPVFDDNGDAQYVRTACIDGKSDARLQTLDIPEDVVVDSIAYNREFVIGNAWNAPLAATTIVLPFDATYGCYEGAAFYKALYLGKNGEDWTIYIEGNSQDNELKANTPYFAIAAQENIHFRATNQWNGSCSYVLNTSSGIASLPFESNAPGIWKLMGTYEKISFDENTKKGVYGFAANSQGDNITAGQFIKAGTGATVPPMRAYLKYNSAGVLAKAAAGAEIAEEDLPETITVKFIDGDGSTTAIGTMNTTTGEISMDENKWFDMKGRMMNKKPTVKGTYYNKGQKVIIK
ncbi:hypothetical protein [Fibrobacter sp. UWH1]|uniref:hypothetical protein n=1 Tax=Fibrobacter sp. UWH1 TaxID=1964354 RepID=UPI000B51E942|nr:hypothetical protein [Fibrobacter sp. UWH1]OWV09215.1 hypothetical protein B7992_12435 [Fibrobacter sp. UWH1]